MGWNYSLLKLKNSLNCEKNCGKTPKRASLTPF